MEKYWFYPGDNSTNFRSKIIMQFGYKNSEVVDTCLIDVPMYLMGQLTFNCESGQQYKLSGVNIDKINGYLRTQSGLKEFTTKSLARARVKLETLMHKHFNEFSDWKDCVNWACAELDIPMTALEFLYPTTEDYLAIPEFKNIRN